MSTSRNGTISRATRASILRLVDANANRALEGVRVCEEIMRFHIPSPTIFRCNLDGSVTRSDDTLSAIRKCAFSTSNATRVPENALVAIDRPRFAAGFLARSVDSSRDSVGVFAGRFGNLNFGRTRPCRGAVSRGGLVVSPQVEGQNAAGGNIKSTAQMNDV